MERKRIYLCLAHMSDEGLEQKYIKEAFDTNWVVPLGPNVNAFEDELRNFVTDVRCKKEDGRCGAAALENKRVVALSAGTAAGTTAFWTIAIASYISADSAADASPYFVEIP